MKDWVRWRVGDRRGGGCGVGVGEVREHENAEDTPIYPKSRGGGAWRVGNEKKPQTQRHEWLCCQRTRFSFSGAKS